VRGEGLLRMIRFPFMAAAYLENEAGAQGEVSGLDALTTEALALKRTDCLPWSCVALKHLDTAALTPRRAGGHVGWGRYVHGGERRLTVPGGQRAACVELHGRASVCAGLHDGSIQVWSRATLEPQLTLARVVWALVSVCVSEILISGSEDSDIRVWDMRSGPGRGSCIGLLQGHTARVSCLARACRERAPAGERELGRDGQGVEDEGAGFRVEVRADALRVGIGR
jgi:hypothetical protein